MAPIRFKLTIADLRIQDGEVVSGRVVKTVSDGTRTVRTVRDYGSKPASKPKPKKKPR